MTDLEYADYLDSVAIDLRGMVGDHIKLATYADDLQTKAAKIRDPNYVITKPVALSGQALAEVPRYVLKDDPSAPEGVPVAPQETKTGAVEKGDLRPGLNDVNLAAEQRAEEEPVADETDNTSVDLTSTRGDL